METQNKLEIHHVAKRLPYGLKCFNETLGIQMMDCWSKYSPIKSGNFVHIQGVLSGTSKPILFPLSSLTETITIKGESFVPIEVLKSNSETPYASSFSLEENNFVFDTQLMDSSYGAHKWEDVTFYCGNQLEMFEKLIEWHFDLPHENLIEKGLAISVFDLTENPYA